MRMSSHHRISGEREPVHQGRMPDSRLMHLLTDREKLVWPSMSKAQSCVKPRLGFISSSFWAASWGTQAGSMVTWDSLCGQRTEINSLRGRLKALDHTQNICWRCICLSTACPTAWAQAVCLQAQLHVLLSPRHCCNCRALGCERDEPDFIYHSQSQCTRKGIFGPPTMAPRTNVGVDNDICVQEWWAAQATYHPVMPNPGSLTTGKKQRAVLHSSNTSA